MFLHNFGKHENFVLNNTKHSPIHQIFIRNGSFIDFLSKTPSSDVISTLLVTQELCRDT